MSNLTQYLDKKPLKKVSFFSTDIRLSVNAFK